MADKAHKDTDKLLVKMELHLKQIYSEAEKEIEARAAEYFSRFEKQDEKKRREVEAGKLTEEQYDRWKKNKILYGERWQRERDRIAADFANVRSTALAYINGELPKVYEMNYNFVGADIETHVKGYSFELVNPDTVRNLANKDTSFLPFKEVEGVKYKRWCTKAINSEILKGIMLGDSIPDLAKRLGGVAEMDKNAATRNARTMVTSAENKARQDGFERAVNKGIILKREWIAAIDNRTRHAHALLNGQLADPNKPFNSELGDIMYPGDPSAHPANVYNCRCTLGSKIIGFEKQNTEGKVLIPGANNGIIMSGKQFGKKIGKHTKEFGLDPSKENDRHAMRLIINEIVENADEVLEGEFRSQPNHVDFYIKGSDVVILKKNKEFISIMKGGVNNARVKNARTKKV